jgi:hypothetical protein
MPVPQPIYKVSRPLLDGILDGLLPEADVPEAKKYLTMLVMTENVRNSHLEYLYNNHPDSGAQGVLPPVRAEVIVSEGPDVVTPEELILLISGGAALLDLVEAVEADTVNTGPKDPWLDAIEAVLKGTRTWEAVNRMLEDYRPHKKPTEQDRTFFTTADDLDYDKILRFLESIVPKTSPEGDKP